MKTCWDCKTAKPKSEFGLDRTRRDGLQPRCKACFRAYAVANKDRTRARQRAWALKNRKIEHPAARVEVMRACVRCGSAKPVQARK